MTARHRGGRIRPIGLVLATLVSAFVPGCDASRWTSDTQLSLLETTPPTVTWPPAGGGVASYEIEVDGAAVDRLSPDTLRCTLEGVSEGSDALVRVSALDDEGSPLGVLEREVSIPDRTAPRFAAGATLSITTSGSDEAAVHVTWPAADDTVGVESYELRVGENTVSVSSTGADSPAPLGEADPTFEVRAIDAAGNRSEPVAVQWSETEIGRSRTAAARRALQDQAAAEVARMAENEALVEALLGAEHAAH